MTITVELDDGTVVTWLLDVNATQADDLLALIEKWAGRPDSIKT